jgi:hypothetical protein
MTTDRLDLDVAFLLLREQTMILLLLSYNYYTACTFWRYIVFKQGENY